MFTAEKNAEVILMAALNEAAVEAVELEAFAKGIPDLVYKGHTKL